MKGRERIYQGSFPSVSPKLSLRSRTQLYIMTDVPGTLSQAECNGDTPPENGQQPITKTNEGSSDVDGTLPYYRVEPHLEDLPTEGNQEKSEKLQGNMVVNWSTDEKILKGKAFSFLFDLFDLICELTS